MSVFVSPSLTDVEQICTQTDPVVRNLQITYCYHELAQPLAGRTAGSANWCVFATWASKQAGQTIRKEDLARALQALLEAETAPVQAAQAAQGASRPLGGKLRLDQILKQLWKAYDAPAAFERASAAVARGNLKVFAEIGLEFARFNQDCLSDLAYQAERIEHFCAGLRPGDPPDGQHYLQQAFRNYYQALFEPDTQARSELLLLANLQVGYHEQTRLQPAIVEALQAPIISPKVYAANLVEILLPDANWLTRWIWRLMGWLGRLSELEQAIQPYLAWAQEQAQALATETIMSIEIPGRRIRLSQDLPTGYPTELQQLSNPELLVLLAQVDPNPSGPSQSGAERWGNLGDRMHFISELFRCYAASAELLAPPFSEPQILALQAGKRPEGRL